MNYQGIARAVQIMTAPLRATVQSLIEWTGASGVSAGAGEAPTVALEDGDEANVLEPYGFASAATGGQALILEPGGDDDNLAAFVASVDGRPATDAGDVAVWSTAGHVIALDSDGALTITGKDGAVITLTDTGAITIDAAPAASITINVGAGQAVNVGDGTAASLLLAQAAESYLIQAATAVTGTPDVVAGFAAFAGLLAGLANAAGTTKAKGT